MHLALVVMAWLVATGIGVIVLRSVLLFFIAIVNAICDGMDERERENAAAAYRLERTRKADEADAARAAARAAGSPRLSGWAQG